MKIDINIDDEKLKELIMEHVAQKVISYIFGDWDTVDWDKRAEHKEKKVNEILSKVNWKNAGPELNQIIMKKFFNTLLEKNHN